MESAIIGVTFSVPSLAPIWLYHRRLRQQYATRQFRE